MATKADYSAEEWQVLQWATMNTMAYLSLADPGFWDSFKEATGAAKFLAAQKAESTSLLIRDLAGDVKTKRDKEATSNPTTLADEVTERVSEAVAIVAEKDAADVDAFKAFIIGIAEATAAAVDGVGETEAAAIAKITVALG